jgi:hypothetical protein
MLQEQCIEHELESYRSTSEAVCLYILKSSCKKIYDYR